MIVESVASGGAVSALLHTFGVSALVWVGFFMACAFVNREPPEPLTTMDRLVAAVAVGAFLLPLFHFSWIGLTGLAIYLAWTSTPGSWSRRGAWIVLAVAAPMFWTPRLFSLFSDLILQADAIFVSWIVGTERVGNAIPLADGTGYLFIAPPCSSLANVSLAILCWVLFVQSAERPDPNRHLWWCLLACVAVVAINVIRISLIGLSPEYYQLLHGPIGAGVASAAALGAMVAICLLGTRRDLLARA